MARTHVLSRLALLRLRFCVEVAAPVRVPPYKGDMLRRALLWYLGTLWCRQPERCRNGCQLPNECLFGRLIEPPVGPNWSLSIRRLMGTTPPPCYVLWDEQDRRRDLQAGDRFHFELTLIGQAAIRQTPAFGLRGRYGDRCRARHREGTAQGTFDARGCVGRAARPAVPAVRERHLAEPPSGRGVRLLCRRSGVG